MPGSVTEEVLDVIAETQRIPREKITIDGRFEELGMDSMDAVNILFALEEKFDITIPDEAAKQIRNIREMVEGVQKLVDAKAGEPEQAAQ
jgi:acyl carrier protein